MGSEIQLKPKNVKRIRRQEMSPDFLEKRLNTETLKCKTTFHDKIHEVPSPKAQCLLQLLLLLLLMIALLLEACFA